MTAPQPSGLQALLLVGAVCALIQVGSASLQRRDFESPNMADAIGRSLVERGEFEVGQRRAYQLPGEPLYLAAGFLLLPDSLWRYLHVPVVVLLVTSIAGVALALTDPRIALSAGLAASIDPYTVLHGPVWDDTFLAAAVEWAILAIVLTWLGRTRSRPAIGAPGICALAALAAFAAMTRTHSPFILAALAVALLVMPSVRGGGAAAAVAIAIGVLAAMGGWGARNATLFGSFYPGTTRDGKALFESNCAYTRQGIRETGVVGGFTERCSPEQVRHAVSLGEFEGDRQLRRYAVAYILEHPVDVAKTAVFKLAVSSSGYDFASPAASLRNLGGVTTNLALILAGIWGLGTLWRRAPRSATTRLAFVGCAATGVATVLMLAIGPVGLRYRISFTGFLYLGCGVLGAYVVQPQAELRLPGVLKAQKSSI